MRGSVYIQCGWCFALAASAGSGGGAWWCLVVLDGAF